MEPRDYIVFKIEGEYATLKDINDGTEVFVNMFILPAGADVGTRLHYENLEYEITE